MTLDGKRVKLQIWDTAGQERFKTITTAYYRGAMGILLVYDVTNALTFDSIRTWMEAIEQHASESVNKVLLGNKADSSGPMVSKRAVQTEVGQKLASEFNLKFFETSAKNNINVDEAFFTIARDIQQRLLAAEQAPAALTSGGMKLGANSSSEAGQQKAGCC